MLTRLNFCSKLHYLLIVYIYFFCIKEGLKQLVKLVKDELELKKQKTDATKINAVQNSDDERVADNTNSALQELYELTQRKFLNQLVKYCSKMQFSREHPRLFCIDLITQSKVDEIRKTMSGVSCDSPALHKPNARRWSIIQMMNPNEIQEPENSNADLLACIRVMCEHENEWHPSHALVVLPEPVASEYSAYLARVMNILKNSSLASELNVLITESGVKLINDLENKAVMENCDRETELTASYTALRRFYVESYEKKQVLSTTRCDLVDGGLKRCELKNGKILWLCNKHIEETNAKVLTDNINTNLVSDADLNSEMLQNLNQIEIEI